MENFYEGLLRAGIGFAVVFIVLVVLMVAILAMRLFSKEESKSTEVKTTAPTPAVAPTSAAVDTNETIAVISATVAAMSGDDPNKRLRVKSIKDQSGNVIWSK